MTCFLVQIASIFARGKPKFLDNWAQERVAEQVRRRWSNPLSSDVDPDKRFTLIAEYINDGDSVADIGCGAGRAENIISKLKNIRYVGYDINAEYISLGKELNREILYMDFSDLEALEKTLRVNKFDVIIAMYSIHLSPNFEDLIQVLIRNCDRMIFGCGNHGHWTLRLRSLFGRTPIYGESLWNVFRHVRSDHPERSLWANLKFAAENMVRDVNYHYPRPWTYRDYQDLFTDIGIKSELVAVKTYCSGRHVRPIWLSGLRAHAFQFVLTKH